MKTLLYITTLFMCSLFLSCAEKSSLIENEVHIIPEPFKLEVKDGSFTFDRNTTFHSSENFTIANRFLKNYLAEGAGLPFKTAENADEADVSFLQDVTQPLHGYSLQITTDKITVRAKDATAAFYAVQTLRQILPATLEKQDGQTYDQISIPMLEIMDKPKFGYRGMHLDVGRHFFPKEFIKEYITYLSMLKMNYFHWHLTEDQGWRIEILQYPNLTKHGAFRNETLMGHYNDTPQEYDGKRYGGFYTQEDIKEIVNFAKYHHVTIIPEIEMPGHAQAAISAYPELGCTGEQIPVATKWGVFEDIYCPKEETFEFLENVLTEVIELFPGEYIHIGGDEAPKKHWKECDHCQQLIKDLDLGDEHGLQSYFIKRIEAFVNSKGKKIIGWDEILEGGLAPNATVMSWRGTEGAVQAAKEGHDVILTPTSHAYFDYYQAENEEEPLAIGGFLPLDKVYRFNPIPTELSPEEATHVLGAQGNIWTEYMPTADQVEYMAFPRMLAMSEVVWNGAQEDVNLSYKNFLKRVEQFLPRMDALDINYANHLYDVSGEIKKENGELTYQLNTSLEGKTIVYTLNNGEEEQVYEEPIKFSEDTKLSASVVLENGEKGRLHEQQINFHKGINGTISLNVQPHRAYNAGGKEALINGVSGSNSRFGDKEWLGFWGDDVEITITFPQPTKISKVSTRFYNANGQWVYAPKEMVVHCFLKNGIKTIDGTNLASQDGSNMVNAVINYSDANEMMVSEIILKIPSYGTIPEGMQGAGHKAWTFIDEIIIE